jgi:hypothetical protein
MLAENRSKDDYNKTPHKVLKPIDTKKQQELEYNQFRKKCEENVFIFLK